MNIFSFRWLRCAPLLTLPVWLGCEVGNTVTLTVQRGEKVFEVEVTLEGV